MKLKMKFLALGAILVFSVLPSNGQIVVDSGALHQMAYSVVDQSKDSASDLVQVQSSPVFDTTSSEPTEPSADGGTVASGMLDMESSIGEEMEAEAERAGIKVEKEIVYNPDAKNNAYMEVSSARKVIDFMETDHPSLEAQEPKASRSKFTCLGCATPVDIDISPENRAAVDKMSEQIISMMDNLYSGPYMFAPPQVLSVTKQVQIRHGYFVMWDYKKHNFAVTKVDYGIRYTVTFVAKLSWCQKETKNRGECMPQEEGRVCVAELLKRIGNEDEIVSNNCTDNGASEYPLPNAIPVMKTEKEVPVQYNYVSVADRIEDSTSPKKSSEESKDESHERWGNREDSHVPKGNSEESKESEESTDGFDDVRMRRWTSNVGALKDVDSNEKDLVTKFAQLAINTLDEVDPDNAKRIVLDVVEAKKQIVNGVMYHLVLHVGTSLCPEGLYDDASNCLEDQSVPEKICRVQVHRSWADDSPYNAKVVKSECADVWPGDAPQPSDRTRRSASDYWPSTDGWVKYALNDTSQADCLQKAMTSFQEVLNVTEVDKVATVKDAHTRINKETKEPEMVVTILLTDPKRLKTWGDAKGSLSIPRPMIVSSRVVCSKRLRRAAPAPALTPASDMNVNVSDPHINELLNFAVSEVDKQSNSAYLQQVLEVINAHRTNPDRLTFTLRLGPSNCPKYGENSSKKCDRTPTALKDSQICVVSVQDDKRSAATSIKCGAGTPHTERTSHTERGVLVGGLQTADLDSPYVQELKEFALAELDKDSSSPCRKIVRVVGARQQVVAGILMHLDLEIAPSNCQKETQFCTLKVWDQPWLKKRQLQDVQCKGGSRSKRVSGTRHGNLQWIVLSSQTDSNGVVWLEAGMVGAPEAVDVNDARVQELVSFAVSEMDKSTNSPYQRTVIRVIEARKQVVAGELWHLKLQLGTTSCRKGESDANSCPTDSKETQVCSLKVWDQPWTKKREIKDVQCGIVQSRRKRHLSSNYVKVDSNDPSIVESQLFVLQELDRVTNSPYRHMIVGVSEAYRAIGEASKFKLTLNVGYSSCRKSSKTGLTGCDLLPGSTTQLCDAEIEHLPWLNIRHLSRLNCTTSESPIIDDHQDTDSVKIHAGLFREFRHRYKRTYATDAELQARFQIFRSNLKRIKALQEGEQGTATYGPTMFADLTEAEFKQKYLGLRMDLRQENAIPMAQAKIPDIPLPTSFDWRDHYAVSPVKNQGACGSCWAFSVTGNLEGQYAIKHGQLLSLSEQELVDCDTLDDGCQGGLMDNAYHALEKLGGIEAEKDYPYEGKNDQCHFNRSEVQVRVTGSVNITTNETAMAQWLVQNGPIAIGINANAMQFYMGGVSHPFKFLCNPGDLDHGVLIVGYGVHKTSIRHKILPYWLIKNSWGTFWGEKGYYRIYRGEGTCGVNQEASSAVVE